MSEDADVTRDNDLLLKLKIADGLTQGQLFALQKATYAALEETAQLRGILLDVTTRVENLEAALILKLR